MSPQLPKTKKGFASLITTMLALQIKQGLTASPNLRGTAEELSNGYSSYYSSYYFSYDYGYYSNNNDDASPIGSNHHSNKNNCNGTCLATVLVIFLCACLYACVQTVIERGRLFQCCEGEADESIVVEDEDENSRSMFN